MKQFACFQLDTRNECLWRNGERIALTPKPFAVLRYLVENPQRLVTHDELLEALWPETYVQPQVLRTYVLELRKVFGDDAGNARFIETVPRRGYRFIAPIAETVSSGGNYEKKRGAPPPPDLVGRAAELNALQDAMAAASAGERQIVFITGEVGIGKTALVDGFCRQLGDDGQTRIARGQSVEGFGGKEAYFPVMEALTQLCTEAGDGKSLKALQQKAPNWHAKLPCVMTSKVLSAPQPVAAASLPSERLLGELCDAIEAMAADAPLVLIFEDLHCADHSTLDLISALARRRAQARLLLIETFRPGDVSDALHPLKGLKQDLLTRKLCREMSLHPLERSAVGEYLARRLRQAKIPAGLTSFLHQHSEGNPLFMIAILDHLISQDYLRREDDLWQLATPIAEIDMGVPSALSALIEVQIERLEPADQRLLEAASLIGVIFPAWAAAAALNEDIEAIEEQYEKLTRRLHFLNPAGHDELPDGTQSAFYVFAHSLYREVLYQRQSTSKRSRRHLRVAERLLQLFAGREQDVASELARHFEAASDWVRAAEALMASARNYHRRGDRGEAELLTRQARKLIENLPERERSAALASICKLAPALGPVLAEAMPA